MLAAVLADDTTGALELGAILCAAGVRSRVSLDGAAPSEEPARSEQALVVDTQTRHLDSAAAYTRTLSIAAMLSNSGVMGLYKKTDSTLRGPIGAELSALLDLFPDRPLVYAPAYPAMNRTVVGGVLYLSGVPLSQTEFAHDLRTPVRQSSIPALLARDCRHPIILVRDAAELGERLSKGAAGTVLVCDGTTESDLSACADTLVQSKKPFIGAGPGGFARYWSRLLPNTPQPMPPRPSVNRWLLVNGSLHPVSRSQAEFARSLGVTTLESSITPGDSTMIGRTLAEATATAVTSGEAHGLIIFGGDTVRAIAEALRGRELTPLGEILPGVPLSILHAAHARLPIVTKAGGFGDTDVVQYILAHMDAPA